LDLGLALGAFLAAGFLALAGFLAVFILSIVLMF
jgi:hypothetical protein